MSNTSSIPVLRGSRSTVLRVEGEELILRQGSREYGIPLAAVARVHARQRTVEVTLTAPAGTAPASHRIEGVAAAAATAFADAVTSLLPRPAEGAAPVDGSTLVTTRTPERESLTPRERFGRNIKRFLWASVLAIVVMCVIASLAQHPIAIIFVVIFGGLGFFFLGALLLIYPEVAELWLLPRRGITVIADYAHGAVGANGYLYGDLNGNTYTYFDTSGRLRIEVSYDPRRPGHAVRADGKGRALKTFLMLVTALTALAFLWGFLSTPFMDLGL